MEKVIECFVTLEQERIDQVELIRSLNQLKRKKSIVPASWIPAIRARIRVLEQQIDELNLDTELKKIHFEYCLSQPCAESTESTESGYSKYVYWAFVYGNHLMDHRLVSEEECLDLVCRYMNTEWIKSFEQLQRLQ
jgi:hypothetical protein